MAAAVPRQALSFYLGHLSPMDWLILGMGLALFLVQSVFCWQALQWHT